MRPLCILGGFMDGEPTSQVQPEVAPEGVETPKEGAEVKAEAPSLEAEKPSETPKEAGDVVKPERTYTQKEWSARESAKDQEIAASHKKLQDLEQQTQLAQSRNVSDRQYAEVLQNLAREEARAVKEAEDKGLDPTVIRQAYAAQKSGIDLSYQVYLREQQMEANRKVSEVQGIAHQYGLTEADYPRLFQSKDPETTAKLLKAERDLEELKVKKAQEAKKSQEFSSSAPTGTGPNWRTLSPEERIVKGLKDAERKH